MQLVTTAGREVEFNLPPADESVPSAYFFSMERSGSSLFWMLVRDLLDKAQRPYCQILEDLFVLGVGRREIPNPELAKLLALPGYVFGVFRELDPVVRSLRWANNKKFLLLRDPRDVLTSYYFSMKGSHRIPAEGKVREEMLKTRALTEQPISEFLRSGLIGSFVKRYGDYATWVERDKNVVLFRYEDVIFNKRSWVQKLIDELQLEIPIEVGRRIADAHDIFPEGENPEANVRQVKPGNFREHMDAQTVAFVEEKLARPMAVLGYVPQEAPDPVFVEHLPQFFSAVSERLSLAEGQLVDLAREAAKLRRKR